MSTQCKESNYIKIREVTTMKRCCLTLFFVLHWCASAQETPLKVYVIADSLSCSQEAQAIIRNKKWTETNDATMGVFLVVCRSALFDPLQLKYGSLKELKRDASMQLNISGNTYHVYMYVLNKNDLSVSQDSHASRKAE